MKPYQIGCTLALFLSLTAGSVQASWFAYVRHFFSSDTVSVIDTATDTVVATIPVGVLRSGVAIAPNGTLVYVANSLLGLVLNFRDGIQKFVRRYDERLAPFSREMFHIAGHKVVSIGCLGALQKNIVVRVGAGLHSNGGFDPNARLPDGAERIRDFSLASPESGPANDFLIFRIHWAADTKASSGSTDGYQE